MLNQIGHPKPRTFLSWHLSQQQKRVISAIYPKWIHLSVSATFDLHNIMGRKSYANFSCLPKALSSKCWWHVKRNLCTLAWKISRNKSWERAILWFIVLAKSGIAISFSLKSFYSCWSIVYIRWEINSKTFSVYHINNNKMTLYIHNYLLRLIFGMSNRKCRLYSIIIV